MWVHMVHLAQTEENGARSYKAKKLAGAISEVREKYATEAQSRGSDSMHGRQNFEAYWNFSLTFPEVLALSFSTPPLSFSTARPHAVPMRGNVPRTSLTRCAMYLFLPRKCLPSAFLRFILYLRTPENRIRPEPVAVEREKRFDGVATKLTTLELR